MSAKKSAQLGMAFGTAANKLRKLVLFNLLQRYGENLCYRCGKEIQTVDELSMDHKEPWLDVSPELFWDTENIAFSHIRCNSGYKRPSLPAAKHGSITMYQKGCRCGPCLLARRVVYLREKEVRPLV